MTEDERDRIELFRVELGKYVDDAGNLEYYNDLFPPLKPKDPIEECRQELEERITNSGYTLPYLVGVEDSLKIYNKHFPKKETT